MVETVNLTGKLQLAGDYDPLKHAPLVNPMERRALALKFAIDAEARSFILNNDATVVEAATLYVDAAKVFEAYITGDTDDSH